MTALTRALEEASGSLTAAQAGLDLILADRTASHEKTLQQLREVGTLISGARAAILRTELPS